jgi:tripartite-type tricarboxylate transporter receptor subunit TctC
MEKAKKGGCLKKIIFLNLLGGVLAHCLLGTVFSAPADFPRKEITIIVNFGPGGARDILARGVGNTMSKYLGVPMVVMNVPGAGGALGITRLYNSAPDGYTVGIGAAPDTILQIIQKQDYDVKKLSYIGRTDHAPGFLFVKSDSPFRTLKDFKAFGKSVRLGVASLAASTAVATMMLAEREGFPLVIVGGYQSSAAAILGLIRDEVEVCVPLLTTAAPYLKTGQMRAFLTLDQKRVSSFPDTPTAAEVGYPDLGILAIDYWFEAPPGVPKDRIKILEEALMKTLKDPEFLKWAKEAGIEPTPLGAQETTKSVLDQFTLMEKYKNYIQKYMEK